MIAAGVYLRTLRDEQKMTRPQVAEELDLPDVSALERVESGKHDSRGSLWLKIVRHLGGSAEELVDLFLDESAGEERGRQAAIDRLAKTNSRRTDRQRVEAVVAAMGDLTNDELVDVLILFQTEKRRRDGALQAPKHRLWHRRRREPSAGT